MCTHRVERESSTTRIKRPKCLCVGAEYTSFCARSLFIQRLHFLKSRLYNDFDDGHFKRERRNEEEEEEEDELRLGRGEKGVFPRRAARAALCMRRSRGGGGGGGGGGMSSAPTRTTKNDVVVIENVVFGAFLLLPTTGKKI